MEISKHLEYAILPLVIAFLYLVHAQDQSGFISLDCGLPKDSRYLEPSTDIDYISDVPFISSGISKSILPEYKLATQPRHVEYVRSFPQGVRNCYKLNVTRAAKYLIRTTFLYGNYDGQNKLPRFDLYLGPNKWVTVNFSSVNLSIMKEIIHNTSQSHLQICLVNTNSGTPFITALELRPLRNDTYFTSTGSGSLALTHRFDIGSTANQSYRYPSDLFDRIWTPYTQKDWTTITTSLAVYYANVAMDFQPPSIVMSTAAEPLNASAALEFYWEPEGESSQYYVYMHTAELRKLQSNQSRMFDIYLNGNKWLSGEAVVPSYLKSFAVYSTGNIVVSTNYSFSFIRLKNSTLPPILNALEVYKFIEFSQPETHQDDADAIANIKSTYGIGRDWQGDPCFPVAFLWSGLYCNHKDYVTPRITSLNLSSSGLTGEITSYISSLVMLESLDLSNNSLTGSVPDSLSRLKKLSVLNLKGNKLRGSVPAELVQKSMNGFLSLSVEDNENLCASLSCKKKKNILIPIVSSIGALLVLLNAAAIFVVLKRKKQPGIGARSTDQNNTLEPKKRQFTYSEVLKMTNNFERTLGKGGFGTVFHGLIEGTEVAVKMLSSTSVQGYQQFQAEVKLLMRVYHGNLTSLVGYCYEGTNMALIYEYMVNGNLESYLSAGDGSENVLRWEGRLQIALDAAHGLEYLHNGCKPPIVHRDVKTSNILLAENFQAKLADFGLSRVFPSGGGTHVSTAIAGTPGYLDPEYYKTNRLNEKSDVYSFGVVVLEIITSQPAISRSEERTHISQWVSNVVADGDIRSLVEPKLQGDFEVNSVWKAVEIAMTCVSPTSSQRPNMNQVVTELKDCLAIEVARKNHIPLTHWAGADSGEMFYVASSTGSINPLPR
ncbi:LRR receptor-like serine/threonine-protein kinase IOS1 [Ziziphus jujuba]|uniref:non-specific serine/threonine protein kinase n=1 Tax=Ziziphus jujuba TaxID=326968 RepID=A0ABM3ZY87_ZIZJJ|nr:LRR receptor-like serine/threonine-protein kinase IOS1 [Ziziphus jujuba]